MEDTTLVFTYGTLKRGFPNHYLIESDTDATLISSCITSLPYPLVIGPFHGPFMINLPGIGHRLSGELYSVTSKGLALMDHLEGLDRGHYERLPIKVILCDGEGKEGEEREVLAYYAHREYGERLWKKCGEKGMKEFTMREAEGYVRPKDRRTDRTFLDEVRLFLGEIVLHGGELVRKERDEDRKKREEESSAVDGSHVIGDPAKSAAQVMNNGWAAGRLHSTIAGKEK